MLGVLSFDILSVRDLRHASKALLHGNCTYLVVKKHCAESIFELLIHLTAEDGNFSGTSRPWK